MSSTLPPPNIAGFEVLDLVGRGSMGTVFAARPREGSDVVALKVLRHEVLDSDMGLVRFERELAALRRIDHPGVTRVFDTGQLDDGRLYLTMELLEGKDLDRCIDEDAPARLDMIECVHEALAPLAAAHAAGIIHRDLKPENVFILEEPKDGQRVKLLDFGIARDLSDESRKTATGVAVGSPAYMSPEQAAKPREVGPATDVWSVGVMLYELLSGELPYDGESPTAVLLAVCTEQHLPLRRLAPEAHPDLVTLVERCLQKRQALRPANAQELSDALGRLLADPAVRASLVGRAATPLGAPLEALDSAAARFDAESLFDTEPPSVAPAPPEADPSGLRDSAAERRPRQRLGMIVFAVLALGLVVGAGLAAFTRKDAASAPESAVATDETEVPDVAPGDETNARPAPGELVEAVEGMAVEDATPALGRDPRHAPPAPESMRDRPVRAARSRVEPIAEAPTTPEIVPDDVPDVERAEQVPVEAQAAAEVLPAADAPPEPEQEAPPESEAPVATAPVRGEPATEPEPEPEEAPDRPSFVTF